MFLTPGNIMSMAEHAGLCCDGTPDSWDTEAIERFAALVAAEATRVEREECARVCEANENMIVKRHPARVEIDPDSMMARKCAAAIRARGENP